MLQFLKYAAIGLALLIGLLLAAPFFIDVDQYREKIEQQVEDSTGRALHIGSIQASLFPWIGLRLDDVALANADGFKNDSFLKVSHLDVQLAFFPLLQKKVEFKRFELDGPELYLERNAAGVSNWDDLIGVEPDEEATAVEQKGGAPVLLAFAAESLQLNKGRFSWQDSSKNQDIVFSNIQLELLDVQQERPVIVNAALSIGDDQVSLKGKVGPVGDLERLVSERLPVQLEFASKQLSLSSFASMLPEFPALLGSKDQASLGFKIELEQRSDGVRIAGGAVALHSALQLDVKWSAEQVDSKHIRVKSMAVSVDEQAILQGEAKLALHDDRGPDVELRLKSEPVTRVWISKLLPELASMYEGHPAAWKQFDVGLLLNIDDKKIQLRDMQVHLDQELVKLSGAFSFASNPDIRLRIAASTLHLDPWLPASSESEKATKEGAEESDSTAVEPDLRPFADWVVSLRANFGQLFVKDTELGKVILDVQARGGEVKISPLSFAISEGRVRENARINIAAYPASWHESIDVSDVKLGPLLKTFAGSDQLGGTLMLATKLRGKGLLPASIKASLTGDAQMKMSNGKIKGFDIAGGLRNIASLGKKNKEEQYTDFAQLQASFMINNGLMKNDDLFMASPLFRLTGKGKVNLPASTVDYHLRPQLVATLVGQGDEGSDRAGITIPLHIMGPFDSPSVRPELNASTVVDSVKNAMKGGGILGNLGKVIAKPGASAPASNPADAAPAEPATTNKEKAIKALGGLISGF